MYLDYHDYKQPLHKKTEVITEMTIMRSGVFKNMTNDRIDIKAQINEISLQDNPYDSPWLEDTEQINHYLTTFK
jgi:hypothetical protein